MEKLATLDTTRVRISPRRKASNSASRSAVSARPVRMAGPPLLVYHACEDGVDDWDVETCVPVEGAVTPSGNVTVRTLPACTVAYTIHVGPYTELSHAWMRLAEWVRERGHECAGPTRDIYLSDPAQTKPEARRTEIQWPIR